MRLKKVSERPTGRGKDWDRKGRGGVSHEEQEARAAQLRLRVMALTSAGARKVTETSRPSVIGGVGSGITSPLESALRWYRQGRSEEALTIGDGRPVADAILATMTDRCDRSVLLWPRLTENAYVALGLTLHDAMSRGRIRRATAAIWPWRGSLVRKASHVLADPGDIDRVARAVADDERAKSAWLAEAGVAHHEHMILSLRLRSLEARKGTTFKVTLPDLRELTPTFAPVPGGPRDPAYHADPKQFLARVAAHTAIRSMSTVADQYLATLGSPARAPIAVFGLPFGTEREVARCLSHPRFTQLGLDIVVVDATGRSRDTVGEGWDDGLARLVASLDRMGDRRPGILILGDDGSSLRRSEALLRKHTTCARMKGRSAQRSGALLETGSLLTPRAAGSSAQPDLAPVSYSVAFTDGALLALRKSALALMDRLREDGSIEAAEGVRSGLLFARTVANLPVGHAEAREVVGILHPGASYRETEARNRVYFDGALRPLDLAVSDGAGMRNELERFRASVLSAVEAWQEATPVSRTLARIFGDLKRRGRADPLIVLPDTDSLEMFLGSNLAADSGCRAVSARQMMDAIRANPSPWVLCVRPSFDTVRSLLLAPDSPERVSFVGDAAGAGMLMGELKPLADMPDFARVRARATALLREVRSSEADVALDRAEARDPSGRASARDMSLDFASGGTGSDRYTGPVIQVATQRGYSIAYRPGSEVVRHTADEIRPFRKATATEILVGDSIVVMTPVLVARLEAAFREALARAPQTLASLGRYHAAVAQRRSGIPGSTVREKAREVVRRIRLSDPAFGEWEVQNVIRWLSVEGDTSSDPAAPPGAPRDWTRFRRFADAIGIPEHLAEAYWSTGILPTRSDRIIDGMAMAESAVRFVVDPGGVQARSTQGDLDGLWEQILENVDTVTHKEPPDAPSRR